MPLAQLEEKRQRRASLIEELRELAEKEDDNGQLSAEDSQEFERREKEVDDLEASIRRQEKLEGFGPKLEKRHVSAPEDEHEDDDEAPSSFAEFNEKRAGTRPQDTPEYREAFFKWVTVRDLSMMEAEELRVLSKASAGAGLNLVPTSFQKELLSALRDFGVMRQIASVVSTSSGEALQWPTVTAHGTASWVAENGSYVASDETFGLSTLNAYKAGTLIKISEELLADSAFDLDAYIRQEFGQRVGVLENTGYVVGDGSGKPTGVTTQASAGVTAASATAVTADELIDLYHSVSPPYRRNGVFLMKDSTIKLVRKLKDTTGQYLWQPGLQAGTPDAVLGVPVYADPDMPAATTGLVSVLFGDFSYYKIRDVDGIAFQRLNELYAENGQVGFRAYHRTDGKLLDTAAVKKLTQL